MIQILNYSGENRKLCGNGVKINSIHDAESLDSHEINVIDLTDKYIWRNEGNNTRSINSIADLKSLSIMLSNSYKSKNVILLPQNLKFLSSMGYDNKYFHEYELKDMIGDIKEILGKLYTPIQNLNLVYENTQSQIENKNLLASFYFNVEGENVLTRSIGSLKPTTIILNEMVISTLLIENYEELIAFLRTTKLVEDKQEVPVWMEEIKMFDDNIQLQIIEKNNETIKDANDSISKAMEVINKNKRYKSILYTNGDELVEVVFEILKEMLGCDLSDFYDKKREDFKFEIGGKTFIGEIKGITPNVKKANISQLDVHVQEFLDENKDIKGDVVALLIINHQRNKSLEDREPVMEDQIKLAERNGSLIVETITLLKLFEQYLNKVKTREECITILEKNKGLLRIYKI